MAPERRFVGENSIVGAGVPVACGMAIANGVSERQDRARLDRRRRVQSRIYARRVAFAAARNLPLLVISENNGWSELTPTSETFKVERISQRASGYGMPGVTIDGSNPMTVRETIRQAAGRAREGRGPAPIECRVPRLWGH